MLSSVKDQTLNHCLGLDGNSQRQHFPKAMPQLDPTRSLLIDAILKGTVKLIDLKLHYILHQLHLFSSAAYIDFTLQRDVAITYSALQILATFFA